MQKPMGESNGIDLFSEEAAALVDMRMVQSVHHVSTGLQEFDRAFGYWGDLRGIPRGEYVILGGKSGVGKTNFALHMVHQAIQASETTCFLSGEMRQEDLVVRALMAISKIPYREWLPSNWTKKHGDTLIEETASFSAKLPARARVQSLVGRSTIDSLMVELDRGLQGGATFFVLDHLQLVKVDHVSNVAERAEIVSETVREWTVANGVTLLALSQIKRSAADDYTRSPDLSDLWGGTAMESNAGIILMIDHSRREVDDTKKYVQRYYLGLRKNRIGPDHFWEPIEANYSTAQYRVMQPDEEYNFPRRPHERA